MFEDDWGGGFDGDFSNHQSRRDMLEIDGKTGDTRGQARKDKWDNQQQQWDSYQNPRGFGGFKNRFGGRGRGRRGGHGSSDGSWLGLVGGLAILLVLIGIVWMSMTGRLDGPLRSFRSGNEANQRAFENSLIGLERSYADVNSLDDWAKVYAHNRIYRVDDIAFQTYPEYIVWVYTMDEATDRPFSQFVRDWETDINNIPIYRLYKGDIPSDHYLNEYLEYMQPGFVFFKGTADGYAQYDSLLTDPQYFNEIKPYTEALKDEYDELVKNRVGTYGQSKGFEDLSTLFE